MPVQFVGSSSATGGGRLGLTSLTGGIASAAIPGDLLVVVHSASEGSSVNWAAYPSSYSPRYRKTVSLLQLAGQWTAVSAPTSPDTWCTNSGVHAFVFPTLAEETPSPYEVTHWDAVSSSGYTDTAVLFVFRNWGGYSAVSAIGASSSIANAPAVTPTVTGSLVLVCGMCATSPTGVSLTAPAGTTSFISHHLAGTTASSESAAALFGWTSGTYDPPAFGGTSGGTKSSWAAVSMIITPQTFFSADITETAVATELVDRARLVDVDATEATAAEDTYVHVADITVKTADQLETANPADAQFVHDFYMATEDSTPITDVAVAAAVYSVYPHPEQLTTAPASATTPNMQGSAPSIDDAVSTVLRFDNTLLRLYMSVDGGDTWTFTDKTSWVGVHHFAYVNNTFLVTLLDNSGFVSGMKYSADAVTWTSVTSFGTNWMYSILKNGNVWVALPQKQYFNIVTTYYRISYSGAGWPPGTWTQHGGQPEHRRVNEMVVGRGKFFYLHIDAAVDATHLIAYVSSDAITWTSNITPLVFGGEITSISVATIQTYLDIAIIISNTNGNVGQPSNVYRSLDGTTWTAQTRNSAIRTTLTTATVPFGFMTFTVNGYVHTTYDMVNYEINGSTGYRQWDVEFDSIAYGSLTSGDYICHIPVDVGGRLMFRVFTTLIIGRPTDEYRIGLLPVYPLSIVSVETPSVKLASTTEALAADSGYYYDTRAFNFADAAAIEVSTGAYGVLRACNSDTYFATPFTPSTGTGSYCIATNGTVIVAPVYNSTSVMRSTNGGATWSECIAPTARSWLDIVWSPAHGKFLTWGYNSQYYMSSPDGITWTSVFMPGIIGWWVSVATNGTNVIVLGFSDAVLWLFNGTTLTFISGGWSGSAISSWREIIWMGDRYLAIADSAVCVTSLTGDAGTWTRGTMPDTGTYEGVAWNGTIVVAVTWYPQRAAVSTDGLSWVQYDIPLSVAAKTTGVTWTGSLFLVTTETDEYATSTNGAAWSIHYGAAASLADGIAVDGFAVMPSETSNVLARLLPNTELQSVFPSTTAYAELLVFTGGTVFEVARSQSAQHGVAVLGTVDAGDILQLSVTQNAGFFIDRSTVVLASSDASQDRDTPYYAQDSETATLAALHSSAAVVSAAHYAPSQSGVVEASSKIATAIDAAAATIVALSSGVHVSTVTTLSSASPGDTLVGVARVGAVASEPSPIAGVASASMMAAVYAVEAQAAIDECAGNRRRASEVIELLLLTGTARLLEVYYPYAAEDAILEVVCDYTAAITAAVDGRAYATAQQIILELFDLNIPTQVFVTMSVYEVAVLLSSGYVFVAEDSGVVRVILQRSSTYVAESRRSVVVSTVSSDIFVQ